VARKIDIAALEMDAHRTWGAKAMDYVLKRWPTFARSCKLVVQKSPTACSL
jgi:hypothetical protein